MHVSDNNLVTQRLQKLTVCVKNLLFTNKHGILDASNGAHITGLRGGRFLITLVFLDLSVELYSVTLIEEAEQRFQKCASVTFYTFI